MTLISTLPYKVAMVDKVSMAAKIKSYRILRCWTQAQMANVLGIHQTAVCKMERGIYRWTDLMVARIMRKLPDLFTDAA